MTGSRADGTGERGGPGLDWKVMGGRDLQRGQKQNWATACRHCGYDNFGIPGNVCPECGEKFVARVSPPRSGSWDARSMIKSWLADVPGVVAANVLILLLMGLVWRVRLAGPPGVALFTVVLIGVGVVVVGGIKLWLWQFEGERDSALVDAERFLLWMLAALTVIHGLCLFVYAAG